MGRTRLIKYSACLDADLAALPVEARLCFLLLPTIADKEGRLEDIPMQISAQVFPYDSMDVEKILSLLASPREFSPGAFITRYETQDGRKYIQINNFAKHQNPHKNEASSQIPSPTDEIVKCHYITRNPAKCISPILDPDTRSGLLDRDKEEGTMTSHRARPDEPKPVVRWEPKPTWKKGHPSLETTTLFIEPKHILALKADFPRVEGNGRGGGVEAEIRKFKRHWLDNPSKAKRKKDWILTLTNWLKNADERFDDARFRSEQSRASPEPKSWQTLKQRIQERKEQEKKGLVDGDTR